MSSAQTNPRSGSASPSTAAGPPSLTVGAVGADVAELRRRLAVLGHDTTADARDHFAGATAAAVARFQGSRGLEPSGVCDEPTWTALIESEHRLGERLLYLRSPMLRGEDIADLQLRLGTLGFDSGRVDGIFGQLTRRAVGEFQRNAGIVSDEVCGPDTVDTLRRLEGRGGTATLASVRERVRLQRADSGLGSLRIALGSRDEGDAVVAALAAQLAPHCAAVAVLDGDWSAQASATNHFDADVYLALDWTRTRTDTLEAHFFSVSGFESVGGRTLAEAVVRELPATGIGIVRGMRHPILRETRAPAVVVKLGPVLAAGQHRDLVTTALRRALERWRAAPVAEVPQPSTST